MNNPPRASVESLSFDNDNKLSLRQRFTRGALALLLVGAPGGVVAGCSELLPDSPEQKAKLEAHELFDTIEASDIIRCDGKKVSLGPDVFYQGKKSPSVIVEVGVLSGDEMQNPWFSDEGNDVGDYWAEVQWSLPGFTAKHFLKTDDGVREAPGGAVIAKKAKIAEDFGWSSMVSGIDTEVSSKQKVIVPFNTEYQGRRTTELVPFVDYVMLADSETDNPFEDKKPLVGEPCITFDVVVHGDKVKIVQ